ncbi:hypothetical protein NP534_22160, partial [Pseudomonas sp. 39004]|uniref:hypothetical protein n=1 Tax=Pseudomonas sp. 39004 TaxID=2967213 RepID=UPI0023648097
AQYPSVRRGKQTLLKRHDRLILGKSAHATAPARPSQRGMQTLQATSSVTKGYQEMALCN